MSLCKWSIALTQVLDESCLRIPFCVDWRVLVLAVAHLFFNSLATLGLPEQPAVTIRTVLRSRLKGCT